MIKNLEDRAYEPYITMEMVNLIEVMRRSLDFPENSGYSIPLCFFTDYYDDNNDLQIMDRDAHKKMSRYISDSDQRWIQLELSLLNIDVIREISSIEKIPMDLVLFSTSHFTIRDFVSYQKGLGSVFTYPEKEYSLASLRRDCDDIDEEIIDLIENPNRL